FRSGSFFIPLSNVYLVLLSRGLSNYEIKYRGSQVIVQAGDPKYRLGLKQGLSESEINWLTTELSQWLGLKIKRTYSNPTIAILNDLLKGCHK
ncbi:hypothetical protein QUA30_20925, partial [Microcoleus sp. Pol14C2]